MGRKITIKVTDDKEFTEEKEGLGFKKIFKSVAGSAPKGTRELRVEYVNSCLLYTSPSPRDP